MDYRYLKSGEERNIWKDSAKQKWEYLDEKTIESFSVTPADIVGDIYRKGEETEDVLRKESQQICVQPFRMRLNANEEVVGYISCEDEQEKLCYIRILQKKRKKWLLPLLLLLLLLVGIGLWYLLNKPDDFLDDAAIAYQMPNGTKNTDPDQISVPILTNMTWKTGEDTIEAALANPEGNPCYFRYIITLTDTDEVLYESKYLEPGTAILEFEPARRLKPGQYKAEIRVKTVNLDDRETEMNGGAMDCLLTVE